MKTPILCATLLLGCSSSSGGLTTPPAPQGDASTTVTQRGRIVDYSSKGAVAGATVTAGAHTVTTGTDGRYQLPVDRGVPFAMTVIGPAHIKLIEQSSMLDADQDRGNTLLVSKADSDLLKGALDGYDATRGVLSIQLIAVGSCMHVAGATVHVDANGARFAYFVDALPAPGVDQAKDGELPTVVAYDLPVGQNIKVTVDHPTCKLAPFPYQYSGITYLGDVTTQAGDATSFARYFLE